MRSAVVLAGLIAWLGLSALSAADPIIRGPWMLLRDDGGLDIVCEIAGTTGPGNILPALYRHGKALELKAETRPLRRLHQASSTVVSFPVTAALAQTGACEIVASGMRHGITLPARPTSSTTVRLAVAGGGNWPTVADLDGLALILGGPVSVVIALGSDVAEVLGRGGWESTIPILPLIGDSTDTGSGHEELVARRAALLGTSSNGWPMGASWGVLGLPAGNDAEDMRRAMANDLSPWQIPVTRRGPWNPGLKAAASNRDPNVMTPVLSLCQRFHVPALLIAGSGTGWISEPLGVDSNHPVIRGGGTRCLGATPSGESLASLPDEIAIGFDRPGLVGITASAAELQVAIMELAGERPAMSLRFVSPAADGTQHGPGWGLAGTEELTKVWLAGGPQAETALDELSWLALPQYSKLRLGNDEFNRLAAIATKPSAERLLRRLLVVEQELSDHIVPALGTLPAILRRDLALRQLARKRLVDTAIWSPVITEGNDTAMIRAVLRAIDEHHDLALVKLVMLRLRNQAENRLAVEADPLLQHRLLCTVLDDDRLSPTPLREIAMSLRNKVDALGKGPIERFLLRVGEKRPVGQ